MKEATSILPFEGPPQEPWNGPKMTLKNTKVVLVKISKINHRSKILNP